MDKLILVLYIDIADHSPRDSNEICNKISRELFPEEIIEKLNATTFIIPIRGGGTKLECINPKFIVDAEVMREHRLKLDILNENFDHFISLLKDGKK